MKGQKIQMEIAIEVIVVLLLVCLFNSVETTWQLVGAIVGTVIVLIILGVRMYNLLGYHEQELLDGYVVKRPETQDKEPPT